MTTRTLFTGTPSTLVSAGWRLRSARGSENQDVRGTVTFSIGDQSGGATTATGVGCAHGFNAMIVGDRHSSPIVRVFEGLRALNASWEVQMGRPRLHVVRYRNRAHVYQRRASCCRFYLVPEGQLCASCPLLSHEERVARKRIDEPSGRRGHW
jgi:hypothetical protein